MRKNACQFCFLFFTCRKLQNIRIAKSNNLGQNELEFLSGRVFSSLICSRANFKQIHFAISYRFRQQLYDQHVLNRAEVVITIQVNRITSMQKHGKGVVTFTTIYDPEEVERGFAVLYLIPIQILSQSFKCHISMGLTKLFM